MELKLRHKNRWAQLGMELEKLMPEIVTVLQIDQASYTALCLLNGPEPVYTEHLARVEGLLKMIEEVRK